MARYWIGHKDYVWVPGKLTFENAKEVTFLVDDGKNGEVIVLPNDKMQELLSVEPDQEEGLDDVCSLTTVNEMALLHTVRLRYLKDQIYTRSHSTLIALNPFTTLPIYSTQIMDEYMTAADSMKLPPHVFGIGQDALHGLKRSAADQAILISGESGAGKTETAKLILSFVADSVRANSGRRTVQGNAISIEERVLNTNPVLEAFGNAMTVRNNNSSRFGKWLDLQFSGPTDLVGCMLTSYLLETTRVCNQARGERGYHVFFQLLQARKRPEFLTMELQDSKEYRYLRQGEKVAPGISDQGNFDEMRDALTALNFDEDTQWEVFSVVAAILYLGNCDFVADGDGSRLVDPKAVQKAAELLGLNGGKVEQLLLFKRMVIGRDVTETPLRVEQARSVRDSLARLLYGKLFLWIIQRINGVMMTTENPEEEAAKQNVDRPGVVGRGRTMTEKAPRASIKKTRLLGVLDIAGFENFDVNSMEQLMINLSNEHLQQNFIRLNIKEEMEDCVREGVVVPDPGTFLDNTDCLTLIDGKACILDLLDETMTVPKATNMLFVTKVLKLDNKEHKRLIKGKVAICGFGIKHFAGDVSYKCEGWLEKNADRPPESTPDLLMTSKLALLKEVGEGIHKDAEEEKSGMKTPGQCRKAKSISSGFRTSLKGLMSKIYAADSHYIRCIKPNREKVPGKFTASMVIEQLLLGGVLATVKIRQQGYAHRVLHKTFLATYGCIRSKAEKQDKKSATTREALDSFIQDLPNLIKPEALAGDHNIAIGRTKVFMKMEFFKALELARQRTLYLHVVTLQRIVRGRVCRHQIQKFTALRREIRALLVGIKLTSNKSSPEDRRVSAWLGDGVLKRLKTLDDARKLRDKIDDCLNKAWDHNFSNGDVIEAYKASSRLELEMEAVAEVKSAKDSVDLVTVEKMVARVKGLNLADFPEVKAIDLEGRLWKLKSQLPLTRAMKAAIEEFKAMVASGATPKESNDPATEQLNEIVAAAGGMGLTKDSSKWVPGLGGAELMTEVMNLLDGWAKQLDAIVNEKDAQAAEAEAKAVAEVEAKAKADKERAAEAEAKAKADAERAAEAVAKAATVAEEEAAKAQVAKVAGAQKVAAAAAAKAAAGAEAQATTLAEKKAAAEAASEAEAILNGKRKASAPDGELPAAQRKSGKRTTIGQMSADGGDRAEQDQILANLGRAVEEYNTDALEELLRRAVNTGMLGQEGHGEDEVAEAQRIFEQLQAEDFLLHTLEFLQAELQGTTKPATLTLKKLENVGSRLQNMPGFEKEVASVRALLEKHVVQSSKQTGRKSVMQSLDVEELGMAMRTFGNLATFSRLKMGWGSAGIRGRRSSDIGRSGMLSHSKECICEALLVFPHGKDKEEYEAAATQNFRNVLVCMGDRPAQKCQREASMNAVVALASEETAMNSEVYVQVLKQLHKNPSDRSEQFGWQLLNRLCQQAPPDEEFIEFVRGFMAQANDGGASNAQMVQACLQELDRPRDGSDMKMTPTAASNDLKADYEHVLAENSRLAGQVRKLEAQLEEATAEIGTLKESGNSCPVVRKQIISEPRHKSF